ncbi:kinesin [Candidatus Magnetomorum sp. HK-1]|nr:kinesin [Candidatus Magnetomorum sp. HK-1]
MANEYWNKIKNWNEKNKTWFWGGIGGVIITLIVTVALTIYSNSGKQNPNSTIKNNNITISGSNNNTFNDLKATEGNINIVTGNGNINKTIIQGIPHQEYLRLGKELGVTENAVKNFFKIIKQKEVSKEDWDSTLRQIATRHKDLQSRLTQFNLLVDPEIQELRKKAEEAVNEGDYDSADKFLDDALERQMVCINNAEKQLNNCKLSAAEMKVDKGDLELIRINYQSATRLFKETVKLVPDGHDLKKAEYLQKWGDSAYDAGLYPESQTALEKCLEIRQRLLPKDDLDLANTLNNLALFYKSQGKYAEAEPLYKKSLEIRESKNHPDVAESLNNLAGLYYSQGKYAEAEPLYQRSLGIVEKALAKDHPNVATTLNNLAALYESQGKYAEAESLYQRSLGIRETKLGKDHPDVAASLNNLAGLYYHQKKYKEAVSLFKRVLIIFEKSLGKDHPNYKTAMENYLIILKKSEQKN